MAKAPATHSAMSKRLLELAAETTESQPYPVTDTITITPLTRRRATAMNQAELRMFLIRQALAEKIATAKTPRPQLATDNPTAEELAIHDNAVTDWEANRDRIADETAAIGDQLDAASDDWDRAFFGDEYDAVIEFFEDKPALWDKFLPDIKREFLPAGPPDGICPNCGHTDPETAGKASSAST